MATGLPRYQTMGVQYADLPQVSTAPQRAAVAGLSQIDQAINQMTSYFLDKATIEAKEAGMKYAAENPLTKEQVDASLGDPKALKVKGAGRIFQSTYEATQASMLASELQLEGQRRIGNVSAAIKAGQPVDLEQIQKDIKDMIDGYGSTVMALDPAQSVKLRASLATTANALYKEAATAAIERRNAGIKSDLEKSLIDLRPVIENIWNMAGTILPDTGKPVNVYAMIENISQPYRMSVGVLRSDEYSVKFDKMVQESKIGALVSRATSAEFAATGGQAATRIQKGDFGNFSDLYRGLTQEEKDDVFEKTEKYFNRAYQARKRDEDATDRVNKERGRVLSLELLNPSITAVRKNEVIGDLLRLGFITPTTALSMSKPASPDGDPVLTIQLTDMARRGILDMDQLAENRDRLTDSQFISIGKAINSTSARNALNDIRSEAGIVEGETLVGGDSRRVIFETMRKDYTRLIGEQNPKTGKLYTDQEAAAEAIKLYRDSDLKKKRDEKRTAAERSIRRSLVFGGYLKDKDDDIGFPIEQIDPASLKKLDSDELAKVIRQLEIYKNNL